jgi:hypothetical protein
MPVAIHVVFCERQAAVQTFMASARYTLTARAYAAQTFMASAHLHAHSSCICDTHFHGFCPLHTHSSCISSTENRIYYFYALSLNQMRHHHFIYSRSSGAGAKLPDFH